MTPLDEALRVGQQDPKRREYFYHLFLNCTLYVPIHDSTGIGNVPQVATGAETIVPVILQSEGRKVLPVFDTVERLQSWAQRPIQFVALPAHGLLETMDPSIHWALNIGTDFFKEFVSEEIQWLRERLSAAEPQTQTYTQGARVLIGPPEPVPEGFLDPLRALLQRNPRVTAAHLAKIVVKEEGQKPHLILVLKVEPFSDSAFQGIAREVGLFAQGALSSSEFLDIIPFTGEGEGLDATIVESFPAIFERAKGTR